MIRRSATPGRSRLGMLMLGLLALCAMVGNGGIVQSHVHPVQAEWHDRHGSPSVSAIDDDCALCDALAAFEPYLPSGITVLAGIVAAQVIVAVPARAYPAPARHRHPWRSRAPPIRIPT